MGKKSSYLKILTVAVFIVVLHCLASVQLLVAQSGTQTEQSDGTRGDVYSSEFTSTRPAGKNPNIKRYRYLIRAQAKPTSQSTKRGKSTPANPSPPLAKGTVYVSIGVTIGHGRPATEAELKDSSIAKVQGKCLEWQGKVCVRRQEMVAERISDNTTIMHETPIQMMIEYLAYKDAAGMKHASHRVGYLYVINRVEFKDKPPSTPKLIFPTMRTFGGDNRVLPGKTVMLPEPQRLWQITRNKTATQAFETYIIILSPEPLKDSEDKELQLNETALSLDEGLVKNWVQRWGGGESQSDLEQGVGQLFTKREQAASGDPTDPSRDTDEMDADLKQDDPPPQMLFSKTVTPDGTMLVIIRLPFKDGVTTAAPGP